MPETRDGSPGGGREEQVRHAAARAALGDVKGMLEALATSGFLAGLVRQVGDQFDALPSHEIETCVAEAVDSFFAAASSGRRVSNPGGWLWKAAWNKAHDLWRQHYSGRIEVDDADYPGDEHDGPGDRVAEDARADQLRDLALRRARELLPLVGTGQVVEVTRLIIEAVEEGLPDLPAKDIAEIVGISEAAARTLAKRGLDRLARAARDAGIILPDDLATGPDDEDETY